jgi:hypothetical protein
VRKQCVVLVLFFLCLCATVLAGDISQLVCDKCRFESNDLFEGKGIEGSVRTIVFCQACKNFYTTPAGDSAEHKEFFGKQCRVYPCPHCQAPALEYDGPACPLCGKGTLLKTNAGTWD